MSNTMHPLLVTYVSNAGAGVEVKIVDGMSIDGYQDWLMVKFAFKVKAYTMTELGYILSIRVSYLDEGSLKVKHDAIVYTEAGTPGVLRCRVFVTEDGELSDNDDAAITEDTWYYVTMVFKTDAKTASTVLYSTRKVDDYIANSSIVISEVWIPDELEFTMKEYNGVHDAGTAIEVMVGPVLHKQTMSHQPSEIIHLNKIDGWDYMTLEATNPYSQFMLFSDADNFFTEVEEYEEKVEDLQDQVIDLQADVTSLQSDITTLKNTDVPAVKTDTGNIFTNLNSAITTLAGVLTTVGFSTWNAPWTSGRAALLDNLPNLDLSVAYLITQPAINTVLKIIETEGLSKGGSVIDYLDGLFKTTFRSEVNSILSTIFDIVFSQAKVSLNTGAIQDKLLAGILSIVTAWVARSKSEGYSLVDDLLKEVVDYATENVLKGVFLGEFS